MRRPIRHFLAVIVIAASFHASLAGAQTVPADAPYKNPATPLEKRVSDLLARVEGADPRGLSERSAAA